MKKILLISFALMAGCATIQSDAAKASAWAKTPAGQEVLGAVTVGISVLTIAEPALAPEAGAVGLAIRGLETSTIPSQATIQATIQSVGGSAKVAAVAAPLAAAAIQSGTSAGLSPSAAVEAVAQAADAAAAK